MNLGLCLAGGGVKGAAHIGAIKAFEEENIKFKYVSGASSGSIVATLYSIGYTSEQMYNIFCKFSKKIKYVEFIHILNGIMRTIFTQKLSICGLNSGKQIEKIINKICLNENIKNISDIKNNLIIPSVDLNTGEIYIFSSKKLRKTYSDNIKYVNDISIGRAVRASCSFPGVFSPCNFNNIELIDGGIRENVPWKETKNLGAQRILCISFEKKIRSNNHNIIDIVSNSFDII